MECYSPKLPCTQLRQQRQSVPHKSVFFPRTRERGKDFSVHKRRHTCAGPVQSDDRVYSPVPSAVQGQFWPLQTRSGACLCHSSPITPGAQDWYAPQSPCCAPCCEGDMLLTCGAELPIPWPATSPERLSEDVQSQEMRPLYT